MIAAPPERNRLEARLAAVAGLAATPVLRARLDRAGPLALRALEAPPDSESFAALLDALSVPETRMFRAAPQLEALAECALRGRDRLTLVSAGCATGEEAWTLAILAAQRATNWRVEGIDLSRPAIAAAEAATYHLGPPDALREVPPAARASLVVAGQEFSPAPALRPRVRFRRANLLDPGLPAAAADAILCRNVLIYMTEAARQQVLARLLAALAPRGVLVLGATDRPDPSLGLVAWRGGVAGLWHRAGERPDG
jgi:chemotaxis protein methyltransferase CheR